jgi:hypothetical protein
VAEPAAKRDAPTLIRGATVIEATGKPGTYPTAVKLVAYAGRWAGPDATIPEGKDRYELPSRFEKSRVRGDVRVALHELTGQRRRCRLPDSIGTVILSNWCYPTPVELPAALTAATCRDTH